MTWLLSVGILGDLWARWSLWISDQFSDDFIWNSIRHRMDYSICLICLLLARVSISGILWRLNYLWIRIEIWYQSPRWHLYDVFIWSLLWREIHILFLAVSLGLLSQLYGVQRLLIEILALFLSCTSIHLLNSLLVLIDYVDYTIERSLILCLTHTQNLIKFGLHSCFWRILILIFCICTTKVLMSCSLKILIHHRWFWAISWPFYTCRNLRVWLDEWMSGPFIFHLSILGLDTFVPFRCILGYIFVLADPCTTSEIQLLSLTLWWDICFQERLLMFRYRAEVDW